MCLFFFQAEDGIRDLVRSRGLGDVYKRQIEIVIGQGAKPGGGGMLLGQKISDRVAKMRTLPALSLIHI